jgi:hypothetical protein
MTNNRNSFEVLPASRGLAWLTASLELLKRDLLRLLLIGLLLQLLAGLTQVGVLAILFVLAVPALSAGMLQAMHGVDAGARPYPGLLFAAFTRPDRLLRLLLLGGLMLAVTVGAVMVAVSGALTGLDADTLARLEQGDVEAFLMMDPGLIERLMLALALGLVTSGTLSFFAIPLVWFRNMPLGQAIWQGLLGMMRNWRPLLVLGLFLGVLAVPAALLSALVLGLNATGQGGSPLLTVLMLFVAVVYQLLLFAGQYLTFRDIFRFRRPSSRGPGDEGQLVA